MWQVRTTLTALIALGAALTVAIPVPVESRPSNEHNIAVRDTKIPAVQLWSRATGAGDLETVRITARGDPQAGMRAQMNRARSSLRKTVGRWFGKCLACVRPTGPRQQPEPTRTPVQRQFASQPEGLNRDAEAQVPGMMKSHAGPSLPVPRVFGPGEQQPRKQETMEEMIEKANTGKGASHRGFGSGPAGIERATRNRQSQVANEDATRAFHQNLLDRGDNRRPPSPDPPAAQPRSSGRDSGMETYQLCTMAAVCGTTAAWGGM